jgi:hypothetical protein
MPNPGEAQNAAVVLRADWTFTLADWSADPRDAYSPLWRAHLVPASYNMRWVALNGRCVVPVHHVLPPPPRLACRRWPAYEIEGIPMRGDLVAATVAWVEVQRGGGKTGGGENAGNVPPPAPPPAPEESGQGGEPEVVDPPAATPSATPSPLPSAFVSTSPSASAAPPSSSPSGAVVRSSGAHALRTEGAVALAAAAVAALIGIMHRV